MSLLEASGTSEFRYERDLTRGRERFAKSPEVEAYAREAVCLDDAMSSRLRRFDMASVLSHELTEVPEVRARFREAVISDVQVEALSKLAMFGRMADLPKVEEPAEPAAPVAASGLRRAERNVWLLLVVLALVAGFSLSLSLFAGAGLHPAAAFFAGGAVLILAATTYLAHPKKRHGSAE